MKGALKNVINLINYDIHTDVIKYITNPKEHTISNAQKGKNELINQGVNAASVQYYNTHQESILLNIVTESDIYDN